MRLVRQAFLAALIAAITPALATAQYIWLDHNNVKQFSDQPPPPSVPANRILKSPRSKPVTPATSEASGKDGASAAAASAPKPPMTTAEQNADFNKRRMEQAEKDKKAAADAQRAKEKADNCERARQAKRSLQSGDRISRTGKDGSREYLSDKERASESRHVDEALKDCN